MRQREPILVLVLTLLAAPAASGQAQFVEQSNDVGLVAVHNPQQTDYMRWVATGMGVGDFNRDGFADLFVISGGDIPDHLFINDGDGTFTDRAVEWGLTDLHGGSGVAVGDIDGDGWLDLYVVSWGPAGVGAPGLSRLYRNDEGQGFTEVAVQAGVNLASPTSAFTFGAGFGDYDLDGHLDLFVTTWENGGEDGNRLFRGLGDGTFADVTAAAIGLDIVDTLWGFQPAFADMNGDLYPELLISADFETSRYFVNDHDGTFTDMTADAGTGLDDNGMGQTVGDFNNDGRLDWYVSSIYHNNPPPGHYQGNTLYQGLGPHQFVDVAEVEACKDGGWGWGTIALDVDQDGWLDIIEVNGRETTPPGEWTAEQAFLFHNSGDGSFVEMAQASGFLSNGSGRGVAWLDAENDGDLDVVIFNNQQPLEYFENVTPDAGHWLQVALDTSGNPRLAPDGFGARLTVTTGEGTANELTQTRVLNGSPSFGATSQLIAHFGLGDAPAIDELRITWSRGYVTALDDVAVDGRITIEAPALADLDANGIVNVSDLVKLILSWGPVDDPVEDLVADVNDDGVIDVQDLTVIILNWGPTG